LGKTEDLERRDEEDNDKEPLHEEAEEFARRELEARAREHLLEASGPKRMVDAKRIHDLSNDASNTDTDEPADNEDDDSDDEIRNERDQPVKEVLE
jgi:chloramphenicol 3-O-phosphotransferase